MSGRPAASPGQLMMVSVLQYTENLTDRQAADAVRDRVSWKYALGLDLEDPGFDASVLSEFRSRLVAHEATGAALDLLLEKLVGLALVSAEGRQRTDSTHAAPRGALSYPRTVGRNSEERFWVQWLTWIRKVKGTVAWQKTNGRVQAYGARRCGTRAIW